jgi:hypothetical protein
MQSLRRRFWVEVAVSVVLLAATVATAANPEWIEEVFGIDPDGGNGSLEWAILVTGAVAFALSTALARREWRRIRHAAA